LTPAYGVVDRPRRTYIAVNTSRKCPLPSRNLDTHIQSHHASRSRDTEELKRWSAKVSHAVVGIAYPVRADLIGRTRRIRLQMRAERGVHAHASSVHVFIRCLEYASSFFQPSRYYISRFCDSPRPNHLSQPVRTRWPRTARNSLLKSSRNSCGATVEPRSVHLMELTRVRFCPIIIMSLEERHVA
jgi:hypothetical protein